MRKDTAYTTVTCDVCKETQIKVPMILSEGTGYLYGYPTAVLEEHDWVVDIELDPQIVISDICPECAVAWHQEREENALLNVGEWKAKIEEEGF